MGGSPTFSGTVLQRMPCSRYYTEMNAPLIRELEEKSNKALNMLMDPQNMLISLSKQPKWVCNGFQIYLRQIVSLDQGAYLASTELLLNFHSTGGKLRPRERRRPAQSSL